MGKTARILVIDDDKSIRKTLALALKEEGYIVDTAETGKEGITKSHENFYNLAIIDWRLPDSEGTEVFEYSTKIKLEIRKSNPQNIVEHALSTIKVPENVKIVNKTKKKPTVYVDANKLRRVCVNIISNAIDAMPDGGTLTITSKKSNDNFELAFSDTGMGMSKENIKKIMTPFFTTKAKGMGLGLAICKRIAEAHNGKIRLESKQGQGTTVTIIVPVGSLKKTETEYVFDAEEQQKQRNLFVENIR